MSTTGAMMLMVQLTQNKRIGMLKLRVNLPQDSHLARDFMNHKKKAILMMAVAMVVMKVVVVNSINCQFPGIL